MNPQLQGASISQLLAWGWKKVSSGPSGESLVYPKNGNRIVINAQGGGEWSSPNGSKQSIKVSMPAGSSVSGEAEGSESYGVALMSDTRKNSPRDSAIEGTKRGAEKVVKHSERSLASADETPEEVGAATATVDEGEGKKIATKLTGETANKVLPNTGEAGTVLAADAGDASGDKVAVKLSTQVLDKVASKSSAVTAAKVLSKGIKVGGPALTVVEFFAFPDHLQDGKSVTINGQTKFAGTGDKSLDWDTLTKGNNWMKDNEGGYIRQLYDAAGQPSGQEVYKDGKLTVSGYGWTTTGGGASTAPDANGWKVGIGSNLRNLYDKSGNITGYQIQNASTNKITTVGEGYLTKADASAAAAPSSPNAVLVSYTTNQSVKHTASDLEQQKKDVAFHGATGVTENIFTDGSVSFVKNGRVLGTQPAGSASPATAKGVPATQVHTVSSTPKQHSIISDNGLGQTDVTQKRSIVTEPAKKTASSERLLATAGSSELVIMHPANTAIANIKSNDMVPSPAAASLDMEIKPAVSAPTAIVDTSWQSGSHLSSGTDAALTSHGSALMERNSADGSKTIVQMSDGTYESVDKMTGAIGSAGTWGDGSGGGVAQNGVGNPPSPAVAQPQPSQPAVTPSVAAVANFKSGDIMSAPATAAYSEMKSSVPSQPVTSGPAFTLPPSQHFGDVSAASSLNNLNISSNIRSFGRQIE